MRTFEGRFFIIVVVVVVVCVDWGGEDGSKELTPKRFFKKRSLEATTSLGECKSCEIYPQLSNRKILIR